MEHLLSHEADEFPEWSSLSDGIDLAPWTHDLIQVILQSPKGEWFLTLSAGLHYMMGRPDDALGAQGASDESDDEDDAAQDADDDQSDYQDEFNDHETDELRGDARTRAEEGAEWLTDQGFDRKD